MKKTLTFVSGMVVGMLAVIYSPKIKREFNTLTNKLMNKMETMEEDLEACLYKKEEMPLNGKQKQPKQNTQNQRKENK